MRIGVCVGGPKDGEWVNFEGRYMEVVVGPFVVQAKGGLVDDDYPRHSGDGEERDVHVSGL